MTPEQLIELNARVSGGRLRLWHGGAPGRRVGDLILPPNQTGAVSMAGATEALGFSNVTSRTDRVYTTTDREIGRAIAAYWGRRPPQQGRGWLYQVAVDEGGLELDEDIPRGPFVSFQSESARVVSIYDAGVDPDDPKYWRKLEAFVRTLG